MSYNYNVNPWDDDPNASSNQSTGGYTNQQAAATTTPSSGYNNPVNQYYYDNNDTETLQQQPVSTYDGWSSNEPYPSNQQQQQYNDNQQEARPGEFDQTGANENANQEKAAPSAFKKFVKAHIPFCSPLLEVCSIVNLPFIDALVQHVNKDLLVSKMFYFFFYSAFGSLFPLMGVYFKQLGMNPAQVGILTGVRPFIEIFSAPFWNSLAERFNKRKALLIFSLLSWIIFTYPLAHIRPQASACIAFNDTDYELYIPYSENALANPDVSQFTEEQQQRGLELAQKEAANDQEGGGTSNADQQSSAVAEKLAKESLLAAEEAPTEHRKKRRKKRFAGKGIYTNRNTNKNRKQQQDEDEEEQEEQDEQSEVNGERDQAQPEAEGDARDTSPAEGDQESGNQDLELRGESSETEEKEAHKSEASEEGENNNQESEEEAREDRDRASNSKQRASTLGAKNNQLHAANTKMNEEPISSISLTTSPTAASAPRGANQQPIKQRKKFKDRHKTPPTHIVGMSPISVEYAADYNKTKHSQFVTPMFSTVVYKLDDIKSVFFLLLLLISLGEFFSAPALTLADSATLRYLGDQVDLYCRQRMFGSLSWAVTLLLVGMALDNATSIADHPCGPHLRERSYIVCYIIFSLLMGCALMTASQFRFDDDNEPPKNNSSNQQKASAAITQANPDGGLIGTTTATFEDPYRATTNGSYYGTSAAPLAADDPYATTQPRSIFNTAPPVNEPPPILSQNPNNNGDNNSKEVKFEFLDKWKSAVFAQRTRELPQWVNVFRQFSRNPFHLTYLFITWFLGCGVGLVFTFLFWHLQDVGGTPTLFGICSVINHISEILAYFFSFSFIKRFGHTRVSSSHHNHRRLSLLSHP